MDKAAQAACAPWLWLHCLRTYAWATLLARIDGIHADAELLYCASALHDLGITERWSTLPGECFAIRGARAAMDLLRAGGAPPDRALIVADAIALHLNVSVKLDHGPEAYLLRRATALDVVGRGIRALPRDVIDEVLERWPRERMKREVEAAMRTQASQSPATRIGFLCTRLQLLQRLRRAPFPE